MLSASNAHLDLAPELAACGHLFDQLEKLRCPLEDSELHIRWELLALPQRLTRAVSRAKVLFKQLQSELKAQLLSDVNFFAGRVSKAIYAAHAVYDFTDLDGANKHARSATTALEELVRCRDAVPELGRHEELFSVEPRSDFTHIAVEIVDLEPFAALWQLAADWVNHREDWMAGELLQLQPVAIRETLLEMHQRIASVEAALLEDEGGDEDEDGEEDGGELHPIDHLAASPKNSAGRNVLSPPPVPERNEILVELEHSVFDFELRMPLITVLRNPGLRDRHWDQFDEISGLGYRPSLQQTLEGVLAQFDFETHLESLNQIAAVASQEAERTSRRWEQKHAPAHQLDSPASLSLSLS